MGYHIFFTGTQVIFFAAGLVLIQCTTVPSIPNEDHCEKAPVHAQPADAKYELGVAGDPDLFLPGELYTVSLKGVDSGQGPMPFTQFKIWIELVEEVAVVDDDLLKQGSSTNMTSLGAFQAYDAQTKLQDVCMPAVNNATSHSKTEIQVIWSAPSSAADMCVRLCARIDATPATDIRTEINKKSKNTSHNRSSILARKLCAAASAPASFTRQPQISDPCCTCDEAKYEVTFEGLWSRNTHPREFPDDSTRPHFGDVIGATHTVQYRVWQEGRLASTGLKRLADDGATTALEKELKAESDHIRTIIKARGISWQQIKSSPNPSTFAVFRVDAKHHLVSLAAKLAPSPDWLVGVSALELCETNCTWRKSITLPLYPFDAGTDHGLSYTSRRQPSTPAAPVRALRPDWPRDVRSPFFSTSGEMRPFARLKLNRLRLYEKSCDDKESHSDPLQESIGVSSNPISLNGGSCATLAWGPWGPCSVSCGLGKAVRQRSYMWPSRAYPDACRVPLTDYKRCYGPRRNCRVKSEYEPSAEEFTGPCALTPWTSWSPCSGCGVRARVRQYVAPRALKHCHVGRRASVEMSQARPCDIGPCEKPRGKYANATNFDWFYLDTISKGECPVTPWSDWSPCSAHCGRGRRIRTRIYISRDSEVQRVITKTLMAGFNRRFAEIQGIEIPYENVTADDSEVQQKVDKHLDRCQFTLTQQEAICDSDESCPNATLPPDVCFETMSVGHCRSYDERWFYDHPNSVCEPFGYSGCGGNRNNFKSRDVCVKTCGNITKDVVTQTTPTSAEGTTKKLKPTPSSIDNEVAQNDEPTYDSDCKTGPWLGWSLCSRHNDYGVQLNFRRVLHSSFGHGKSCPTLIKKRVCKSSMKRKDLLNLSVRYPN